MPPTQNNLLGLDREQLSSFAETIGEARYRGQQIFGWLYTMGARDFQAMTNLGKAFRARLENAAAIRGITLLTQQQSMLDGTTKFLFGLPDGLRIESVLIPPRSAFRGKDAEREDEQTRLTLCVSTQVGCPLECKFCATGAMGFTRNLTTGEIVDQILQVKKITGRAITNVVFMGMGEPMMNYDSVMRAADIITSGIGIAARHMTLSTAGWAERIRRLGEERRKLKLAVSLHSAIEKTRLALMPVTKRFSLAELRSSLEYYYSRTGIRVTYEVIFFDAINDTDDEVAALIRFARHIPSKINVIPFHSIAFTGVGGVSALLRPSSAVDRIVAALRAANLTVLMRTSSGEDIDAACGQLALSNGGRSRGAQDSQRRSSSIHQFSS